MRQPCDCNASALFAHFEYVFADAERMFAHGE